MANRKTRHKTADEIREELEKQGITEKGVANAVKWASKTKGRGGILEKLRKWPIADLNLKRPRAKPRKIDL